MKPTAGYKVDVQIVAVSCRRPLFIGLSSAPLFRLRDFVTASHYRACTVEVQPSSVRAAVWPHFQQAKISRDRPVLYHTVNRQLPYSLNALCPKRNPPGYRVSGTGGAYLIGVLTALWRRSLRPLWPAGAECMNQAPHVSCDRNSCLKSMHPRCRETKGRNYSDAVVN